MNLTLLHSSTYIWVANFLRFFFTVITILGIIFIIGMIIALKYNSYRKTIGTIFTVIGMLEITPYIMQVIQTAIHDPIMFPATLMYNPMTLPLILGCITLTGGLANIKKIGSQLMLIPIIAATVYVAWIFVAVFPYIL